MRRRLPALIAGLLLVATPLMAATAPLPRTSIESTALTDAYNHQTDIDFRVGLQMRLAWTGDYTGEFDGDIDQSSIAAIEGFQTRNGIEADGIISEALLKRLLSESDAAKATAGFAMVEDEITGSRIGLPLALVRDRGASDLGHLWRSDDGTIEIESVRIAGALHTLSGLYDLLSQATSERSVDLAEWRSDGFDVSGTESGRPYRMHFAGRDGDIRGFSISYDETASLTAGPIATVAANLFEPFGTDARVASIGLGIDRVVDRSANAAIHPASATAPETGEIAPQPSFDTSGSGFVVSRDGWLLTNAHVARSCKTVLVGNHGAADRVVIDEKNDLALVHVGAKLGAPLPILAGVPRLGEDVLALGYPLRSILADSLNVTRGNISSLLGLANDPRYLQISAPVQPGNSGGPLVDLRGRVVGIVTAKLNAVAVADATGDIPQSINFAIRPDAAVAFLRANHVAFTPAPSSGKEASVADTTEHVAAAVMPILCLGSE